MRTVRIRGFDVPIDEVKKAMRLAEVPVPGEMFIIPEGPPTAGQTRIYLGTLEEIFQRLEGLDPRTQVALAPNGDGPLTPSVEGIGCMIRYFRLLTPTNPYYPFRRS